jgi:H+/Cl- antiporter ClcA
VLHAGGLISFPLRHYWLLIVLGVITGLSGVLFNRCILLGKAMYEKLLPRNKYTWLLRGVIPFSVVALICLAFPRLLGSGEPMIFITSGANPPLSELLTLYAAKLALLTLCFGSGLPGGIFFPLLVLGSLVGASAGTLAVQCGVLEAEYVFALALMAMAGHFASIVRSPLTGILLVCEMTGAFAHILPLGIVAMVSYGVAEQMRSEPIYESLQKLL